MLRISKSSATRQNIMQWIGNIYYDPFTSQFSESRTSLLSTRSIDSSHWESGSEIIQL